MSTSTTSVPLGIGLASTQEGGKKSRIQVIDALRGCALFGIILTHVCLVFIGVNGEEGANAIEDTLIYKVIYTLFIGKASAIFSFLFGLSFALQAQSAKSKGQPFIRLFTWRLVILFVIGYLNSLLFTGDILQTYAVMGLLLLPFLSLGNKAILATSALLYSLALLVRYFSQDLEVLITHFMEYASGSMWLSFLGLHKLDFFLVSGRAFTIPSLFLLGLLAGRKAIFSSALGTQGLLLWSGMAFLVSTGVYYIVKDVMSQERISFALNALRQVSQAFLYVAVVLTFSRLNWFMRLLGLFVPVGQMGLSTYLMQSVFLLQLSSMGIIELNSLGLGNALGIAVLFFIGQSFFAYWWMAYCRFGPVEWLWRSLIHFKLQPLKKRG